MEQVIQIFLFIALGYLVLGLIFSVFFYLKGMDKVDEVASESNIGFKLIIFPGIVVFWPFLLSKIRSNN